MQELLVERARRGDRDAFAALAARVIDRCYGLAYAILRDAELAHDAVQDALLGAWRDLPKLREVDKFEAWLHSLVVHACYAQSRRDGAGRGRSVPSRPTPGVGWTARNSRRSTMDKIAPCLWFDGEAEEAARFYTSLFPDSRIDAINRSPAETPSGPKDSVLTVDFTLAGHSYIALNGGPEFKFSEAISLSVDCEDQAEVDRYWDALLSNGGEPSVCGWLKDRFGLSWQVVPRRMNEMFTSPDRAAAERAMKAMLDMVKLDVAELERAFAGEPVAAR